jgi:hypothetical protein
MNGARGASPRIPAGVPTRLPAVVPGPPYVPFMPSSTRRTATARGLRRCGAATSLRLLLRVFPPERRAVNVSHRVISPSVFTAKLPVAGCWR